MRSCLIVTGGRLDMAFARCFLNDETFDKVIAVDAGLEAAEKLGIVPDYVVGDFDTVSDAVVEYFKRFPFIVWKHHKPEKNETDTELALYKNRVSRRHRWKVGSYAGEYPCAEGVYGAWN